MRRPVLSLLLTGLLSGLAACPALAQAPGVKIVQDRGEEQESLVEQANAYREAGKLLSALALKDHLSRTSCVLKLPKPDRKRLTPRQIWERSRESHVRLGWLYLCQRCDKWHLNLAGGFFLTADGAVATCYHVVKPNAEHREAYLVAADEQGRLFPVSGLLAGNERADVAIVRAEVPGPVKPLALNTNIYPGDRAWCYSAPLGRGGYFSEGMVNRFYFQQGRALQGPRLEVSTEWAPGSSGAAVLDERANAMGLVSTITPAGSSRARGTNQTGSASAAMITFHCASRAADVLALIQPAKPR